MKRARPAPSLNLTPGLPADGETAMPTDVVMPQMGESIFEGAITKWLKRVGDRVEKDEPLFEISTDKVDAEIPSPAAGILIEIKVPEGATVDVDTVVAVISDTSGAGGGAFDDTSGVGGGAFGADSPIQSEATIPATVAAFPAPAIYAAAVAPPTPLATPQAPLRSSPLVRRIAKDHQLDLSQIAGTGAQGRITKEDILRHLSEHGPGSSAPKAPPAAPQVPPKAQLAAPQAMSKMRAIIAQRMVESVRISPHVHTVYKIDMTRISRLRERERAGFEQRHGVKLTYMPFIAAAAAEALAKIPIVNASLIDGFIHYHPQINLGIAVALEWGLIVPVVRGAEGLSFSALARTIVDLAERARTKKLLPDEVLGGTFTLTNSGVFGGEFGTPILNQPEAAILAIGGLRKEPVVLADAEGNDTIAIRSMQHFCLGFDHRLIDGADAGKFMHEFKKTLENWTQEIG
ncbi:MAG: dihydrolipoamide acetyltransferase family protein [Terracidiphilus sp.]